MKEVKLGESEEEVTDEVALSATTVQLGTIMVSISRFLFPSK